MGQSDLYGKKFEIDDGNVNVLVGRILTIIDATYQDKEQREAAKTTFRRVIWNWVGEQRGEMGVVEHWVGSVEMAK